MFAYLKEQQKFDIPPRKLAVWQLFMKKEADAIDVVFQPRWQEAGLESKFALAFRGQIARELLAQRGEEYRNALQQETQDIYERDMAEYEAAAVPPEGPSQADQLAK